MNLADHLPILPVAIPALAAPLALLLASCGGEAPKEEAATKPPTAMPMGEWEVTATGRSWPFRDRP